MSTVITRKSRLPFLVGTSTENVMLSLSYGFGQIGGSALEREPGKTAEVGEKFDLGPANALVGRFIIIKSVVADFSDATNNVNVIYSFQIGANNRTEIKAEPLEVENDGDPAVFLTRFDILKAI